MLRHEIGYLFKETTGALRDALWSLAEVMDNDFNGENGIDFTWPCALEGGFECSFDYLWAITLNKYTNHKLNLRAIAREFIDSWMGHDSYFDEYDVVYVDGPNNELLAICIAYTTNN